MRKKTDTGGITLITDRRGISPVEALLTVTIFALIATAFFGALIYSHNAMMTSGQHARALMLAEAGIEVVRNIRDEDFALLADGSYGIDASGNEWQLSGTPDTNDIFSREVSISSVDATTKAVTSTVTWEQNAQRSGSITLSTYLTNWMLPDPPASGDWSLPAQASSLDINGGNDGWKIDSDGDYAYLVRLNGNPNFAIIDISDPSNPTAVGSLNLNGNPRDIIVNGDYAYVASTQANGELITIDISNPAAPNVVDTFNMNGPREARALAIDGNHLYAVRRSHNNFDEFHSFDITSPDDPDELASIDLGSGTNYDVVVIGDYAYVASTDNNEEVRIVDISDPSDPIFVDDENLANNSNAFAIAGEGNVLLVGRQSGEMFVMNLNNPLNPVLESVYSAGNAIRDISYDADLQYAFLATDENSAEFQVVDLSNLALPTLFGSLDVSNDLNGVVYDADLDRAFAVGESNSEEFVVFEPQ